MMRIDCPLLDGSASSSAARDPCGLQSLGLGGAPVDSFPLPAVQDVSAQGIASSATAAGVMAWGPDRCGRRAGGGQAAEGRAGAAMGPPSAHTAWSMLQMQCAHSGR